MTRSPIPLFATGIRFSVGPFDVSKWIDPVKAWSVTPVRKPVPSSIFLPLRLSWFLFSLDVSTALIDFKIVIKELISFVLASTSSCVELFSNNVSADSSFLVASSISDFCLVLFFTLSSWAFNSSIFLLRSDLSTSFVVLSSWLFSPDWTTNFSATAVATFSWVFSILLAAGFTEFSETILAVSTPSSGLLVASRAWVPLSLASTTPAPKNIPTPIRTLAAPTLNFFMEYVSTFSPRRSCCFFMLFFPTI